MGQKSFRAATNKGHIRDLTAQVADTNKSLAAGNTVVFAPEGSYIQDGSGETIHLESSAGMYTVKLWVAAGQDKQGQVPVEGF